MSIEEREFRFASRAPLHAWRLFRVRASGNGFVLSSPMYDDPDPTPWPRAKRAACNENHSAPAPGCRCGIYAVIPGTLDSLPGYLRDTAHDKDPWAYAEVACTGRVFVDFRGVRSERAEIRRVALPGSCWPNRETLAAAKQLLAEHYGVPVGAAGDVPHWVTANLRPQGPPPDGVTPSLDMLDLEPLAHRVSTEAATPLNR